MQKLTDRLVSQLKVGGMPDPKAHATATSVLRKAGDIKKGSNKLTPKGEKRQAMGAAGRAKDRAATAGGKAVKDYAYNARTNRATLKD